MRRLPFTMTIRRVRLSALASAVMLVVSGTPTPAPALICPMTSAEMLISGSYSADVLFRGTARENRGDWTRFEVTHAWSGVETGSLWLRRDTSEPTIPVTYQIDGDYLVIASKDDGQIVVKACDQLVLQERFAELVDLLDLR